jgi:hypothetical protein
MENAAQWPGRSSPGRGFIVSTLSYFYQGLQGLEWVFFGVFIGLAFRSPIEAFRARFCADSGADPVRSGPWVFEGRSLAELAPSGAEEPLMRELGQPPAQNRAHGDRSSGSAAWERPDGARFFWSLFFAGPKKSDPGPKRSAWRISASGAPGARRSATGPGEEGAEPPCLGI